MSFIKKVYIFGIILVILCVSGCWVKVSDETESVPTQEEKREIPKHLECFERFKNACNEGQWAIAYQELSSRWKQNRTLEQFQANMEKHGLEHMKGAKVVKAIKNVIHGIEMYALIILNYQNFETQLILIQEPDGWKIDGVVRPIPQQPEETPAVKSRIEPPQKP